MNVFEYICQRTTNALNVAFRTKIFVQLRHKAPDLAEVGSIGGVFFDCYLVQCPSPNVPRLLANAFQLPRFKWANGLFYVNTSENQAIVVSQKDSLSETAVSFLGILGPSK